MAERVVAYEGNEDWLERLRPQITGNVTLHLSGLIPQKVEGGPFDVIVVDGLDRAACARLAPTLLRPGGAVLFDNSEGFWGEEGTYPVIDFFHSEGFQRVDFYGYAPGVSLPSCTSLFFRSRCFLLEGREPPRVVLK